LCRTAASFVSAVMGIISKPPILPSDLGIARERNGGLIVVGSYVPKTTKQVINETPNLISSIPNFSFMLMLASCIPQVEELKLQCGQFLKSIEVTNIPSLYLIFHC